jgi:hypothetical protein
VWYTIPWIRQQYGPLPGGVVTLARIDANASAQL